MSLVADGGDLNMSDTDFYYNSASGAGGGMYVSPVTTFGGYGVNISGGTFFQNSADGGGGAVWLGQIGMTLDNVSFGENRGDVTFRPEIRTFNTDSWVYGSIWCTNYSTIDYVNVAPWTAHSPPLLGDGTCAFP